VIGKLKSMIRRLRGDIISYAPIKGIMLRFEGNGTGNPTILVNYNVASVTRVGVGLYQAVPLQTTMYGQNIVDNSTTTQGFFIQPTAVSEAHFVSVTASGANFNINVTELTVGGGNKLEVNPYDIIAGDRISINVFVNAGDGDILPA